MKTNKEYKNEALAALRGNWPQAVLTSFVVLVFAELIYAFAWGFERIGVSDFTDKGVWVAPLLSGVMLVAFLSYIFFLTLPVAVGMINAFSRLYSKSEPFVLWNMKTLAFSDSGRNIAGMLMVNVITSLFSILLVVPGVIASLALFLVPYLLKDNPDLSIMDTLRLSRKMMEGHKMQLFKLQLSFFGWILINMLTLGVGSLWLIPYMMTACAAFYQDVKAEYFMKEAQQESAL